MRSTESGGSGSSSSSLGPILGRPAQTDPRAAAARSADSRRKNYSRPQLTHYGHIEKITMSSGGGGEGDFGMNSKYGFGQGRGHGVTQL